MEFWNFIHALVSANTVDIELLLSHFIIWLLLSAIRIIVCVLRATILYITERRSEGLGFVWRRQIWRHRCFKTSLFMIFKQYTDMWTLYKWPIYNLVHRISMLRHEDHHLKDLLSSVTITIAQLSFIPTVLTKISA